MAKLKITGRIAVKPYQCQCGHISQHSTNHYGEIYLQCNKCLNGVSVHTCLEPLPKGWGKPTPWKMVKLGDLVKIEKFPSK